MSDGFQTKQPVHAHRFEEAHLVTSIHDSSERQPGARMAVHSSATSDLPFADIAFADLSPVHGRLMSALASAGVANPQRFASELQLEYRRYLLLARLAGGLPAVSAALRSYAATVREAGLIEPGEGPALSPAETSHRYDEEIPFGNRDLFLGSLSDNPQGAPRTVTYRESVPRDKPVTWRVGSLAQADASALDLDAEAARPTAQCIQEGDYGVDADGRLFSPRRTRFAESEETAWRIFSSADYIAEVSRLAGEPLFLVRASYLLYEDGDYLGMHTDSANCKYVSLMSLVGEVAPLRTYTTLRGTSAKTLAQAARAGRGFPTPDGELAINGEPLLMQGAHLPHARARHHGRPILLVSACFDTLAGPSVR